MKKDNSPEDNPHTTSLANIRKGIKKRNDNKIIYLPPCPDSKRGAPNSFIRSSLFAAIQGKDRQFVKRVTLASQDGITVKFTGEQLNQTDLEVWEAIVHKYKKNPLGEHCVFTAHELLKTLGLPTGNSQHQQLHETIIRLTACAVEIDHEGGAYAGPLIKSSLKDKLSRHYGIELNKTLINLFGETQWTALDWDQRKQLREKPLAQALHAFYSSHRKPYPLKLETLQAYTGSRNSQKASFKRQVKTALESLVQVRFLSSFKIEEDMVQVERALPALKEE